MVSQLFGRLNAGARQRCTKVQEDSDLEQLQVYIATSGPHLLLRMTPLAVEAPPSMSCIPFPAVSAYPLHTGWFQQARQ